VTFGGKRPGIFSAIWPVRRSEGRQRACPVAALLGGAERQPGVEPFQNLAGIDYGRQATAVGPDSAELAHVVPAGTPHGYDHSQA